MITSPRIAIIGAGMSGLCMAMKLQDAGIESYTIYELASDVGGTWRDNTYPGLSCDVPSRFYSYSFQPNPSWTHTFSSGTEIQAYFQRICDERGIRPHIRFNTAVDSACYQDGRWRLRTRSGDRTDPVISDVIADVVVTATGVLRIPRYPDIAGLDSFTGPMFHSARWDHSVSLSDKRIGLIGTGSSGVQIITELAGKVRGLTVFQRTAQWVLPMPNRRYSRLIRSILERFPRLNVVYYRLWQTFFERMFGRAVVEPGWRRRVVDAWCRWNLSRVRDPELRRRLTPDYRPMCKRLVMSAGYYRAMQKPGVHLVTEPIDHVEPTGIVTVDGRRHELDMIVLATGFEFHAYVRPLELRGENGLTLDEAWADGPRAYRTVAMPGFPNLFMLMGPHSPVGNQSLVLVAESQADYALWWIDQLRRSRIASAAPTVQATAKFNADMKAAMPQTIWVTGCRSWYLGRDGLPELFPWRPERHRELLAEPVLADFDVST